MRKKGAPTIKQMAYARKVWGGQGISKKQIALDCGYSTSSANSVMYHIEDKVGFKAAMTQLASDSNNLAMAVMFEFKKRGFEDFSNKELVGALNAIGSAWDRFAKVTNPDKVDTPSGNRLRTVILNRIENQTINSTAPITPPPIQEIVEGESPDEMDF